MGAAIPLRMALGDNTWLAKKMDAAVKWGNETTGAKKKFDELAFQNKAAVDRELGLTPQELPKREDKPPDMSNEILQAAQRMERLRNARLGRAGTFLTGPQGARPISAPPKGSLLGS